MPTESRLIGGNSDRAVVALAVEDYFSQKKRWCATAAECLTRWAVYMDPYTLAYLVGHGDYTTRRFVHPRRSGRSALGGHSSGHSGKEPVQDRSCWEG